MDPLPIDEHLPAVVSQLRETGCIVVEAPPGAGKTTRLPVALLRAGLAGDGRVLVLEPRRIAARAAARRVAEELEEPLGATVGYRIRFESVGSADTRLWYLTEGVLSRMLAAKPTLPEATVVVLDEFHERHLHADLALALCRALQLGRRPDLRLVVMSATLEAAPVCTLLGNCPRLLSTGRQHEVRVEHLPRRDDRPTERLVCEAVERLLREGLTGHILVFLPGAAEIRRAAQSCRSVASLADLDIVPLHGQLPSAEQDRAMRPSARRKLVLATNVAETSLTIDDIEAVVDTGLERSSSVAPWSGLPSRRLGAISQASASQRAGRAGRTRAGRCLRLYTEQEHARWRAQREPEVLRADLCELVLTLRANGWRDPGALPWLDPPPAQALGNAERLVELLGAVDAEGALSPIGRRLLRLPVHPRIGRMLVEAERRGVAERAATMAALLGERELALSRRVQLNGKALHDGGAGPGRPERRPESPVEPGDCDVADRLELYDQASGAEFAPEVLRVLGIDRGAAMAVARTRRALLKAIRCPDRRPDGGHGSEPDAALRQALLAAFPDRVARRVRDHELALAAGGSATLGADSCVVEAPLLVAVDAEEQHDRGKRRVWVRAACAIEADWLLEMFPAEVKETSELVWHSGRERVERVERLLFQSIALEELRDAAPASREASRLLREAVRAIGLSAIGDPQPLEGWVRRVAFANSVAPELGLVDSGAVAVDAALDLLCEERTSLAELRRSDLLSELSNRLPHHKRQQLEMIAPEFVQLPSGRRLAVHYETDRPPWVASRLQDFFGMKSGPSVARGRLALVLHLLAPSGRPVQVTSDLAGFWERTYAQVRRELCRRYPKHPWPEDGRTASPPKPGRVR